MLACAGQAPGDFCTACFSGQYPMSVSEPLDKFSFEPRPAGTRH